MPEKIRLRVPRGQNFVASRSNRVIVPSLIEVVVVGPPDGPDEIEWDRRSRLVQDGVTLMTSPRWAKKGSLLVSYVHRTLSARSVEAVVVSNELRLLVKLRWDSKPVPLIDAEMV